MSPSVYVACTLYNVSKGEGGIMQLNSACKINTNTDGVVVYGKYGVVWCGVVR